MLPEMKDGMRIRRSLTGMRDADISRDLYAEGNGSGGSFAGSVTGGGLPRSVKTDGRKHHAG